MIPDQRIDPDAPWIPEGLAEKLVVGARVRWRKNPECDWKCPDCKLDLHVHYPDTGVGVIHDIHLSEECQMHHSMNGCDTETGHKGHYYRVVPGTAPIIPESWDKSYKVGNKPGLWAAAIELTPLEDDDVST